MAYLFNRPIDDPSKSFYNLDPTTEEGLSDMRDMLIADANSGEEKKDTITKKLVYFLENQEKLLSSAYIQKVFGNHGATKRKQRIAK